MKKLASISLMAITVFFCGCQSSPAANKAADEKATDYIDSSAIINDSTLLPTDSTATGVQH